MTNALAGILEREAHFSKFLSLLNINLHLMLAIFCPFGNEQNIEKAKLRNVNTFLTPSF